MKAKLTTILVITSALSLAYAAKPTVKEVMKAAMKGDDSLYKKVCSGSASEADAKKLAACLQNLDGSKPSKGDEAAYTTKISALIKAANEVAEGKKESIGALKETGNCKACHSEHKK